MNGHTWSYRIVRYADGLKGYALHEVHYTDGVPVAMGETPAVFVGETRAEIGCALTSALYAATDKDVLDEPEGWVT